jgi:hypothetical protein
LPLLAALALLLLVLLYIVEATLLVAQSALEMLYRLLTLHNFKLPVLEDRLRVAKSQTSCFPITLKIAFNSRMMNSKLMLLSSTTAAKSW